MTMPPPETLEGCIRLATTAPSLHNSQPWLFRVGDGVVDVYADWRRQLEVLDPTGRELLISVGAAVFTLGLALRGAGYRPEIGLFPDAGKPNLVARLSAENCSALDPAVRDLAAAIPHRHTNRYPFASAAVPADAIERLIDAARQEAATLTVANPVSRNTIIRLSQDADRRQRAIGGYRAELARWTTHRTLHRDGVPPLAIGPWDALEIMPIRDFGLLQPHLARTAEEFEPDPTLVVLATAGDDRADWVRAGQALQRVLLTATWQNLATTPVSQPVEIPAVRSQLSDPARGIWAQMILRVGYGRPAASTPRRPLSDVLLTSDD
ncbi:nitroreductase [Actinoplanes sp. ATCC 53533]|uniref:Acg family FMN-binding oxidoreductase n=1 Tax=Actinoplanes sp. ATCC 53533 TaxID=1288362 RepID=UPI000F77AAB8|nr:nitroreductase family protein [Actinoplanes sp. ATCC 53533]RSM68055.1 nitroreductase [Actinoplanes sp. ATCC 53533]